MNRDDAETVPTRQTFAIDKPELGLWQRGNTGVEGVWQFESEAHAGPSVMITALVHGNELCGAHALLAVLRAGVRPRRGRLTLAFCNLAAFERFDPADPDASRFVDEDLNRVWGAALQGGAQRAGLERRRALELLPFVEQSDCLLDLHSMHEAGPPLLLVGTQPSHLALGLQIGSPMHVVVDAGHSEGCRLRDHGRFSGRPGADGRALLIECGYHGDRSSPGVALDAVARMLVHTGLSEPDDLEAHWWLPAPPGQVVLDVTDAVVARGTDVTFERPWLTGEVIHRAGTLLGWNAGEPILTPYDQCTLVMPSLRQLRPGVTVMRLARTRPPTG